MTRQFLSDRVLSLKPSGIRKFFDIINSMPDVISLGVGEPDFASPAPVTEAAIAALRAGKTAYTSNYGILELREILADYLKNNREGLTYDPLKEIIFTAGLSEAIYITMSAILNPGDEVIVPTPCFVAYQPSIELAGGISIEVPSKFEDDFQPDIAAIEAAITPRTKAIFISYPNNPTGAVVTKEVALQLAEVVIKHDLLLLSDEIYEQLVYSDHKHVIFPNLPGLKERTIYYSGFSKSFSMTGWRLGYICAPPELIAAIVKIHQFALMSAPTISQHAAMAALTECQSHVDKMVAEYDRRRKLIVNGMNTIGLPTFEPKGAFYAFPKVDVTGLTSEEFAEKLLYQEKVAVVPGNAFGAGGEGFVRTCYATSYEQIEQALEKIEKFVKTL